MSNWRNTREYRVWRVSVIRRDRCCVVCGSKQNRHAHHLNSGAYFKEDRYDISNGVCLCRDCHMYYHTSYNRSYRVKCTKSQFDNFKELVGYLKLVL